VNASDELFDAEVLKRSEDVAGLVLLTNFARATEHLPTLSNEGAALPADLARDPKLQCPTVAKSPNLTRLE
jgi:hypothetical protein